MRGWYAKPARGLAEPQPPDGGPAASIVRHTSDPVIRIRGLRKAFGDVEAVRGIDLNVQRGEIFTFLGPNGAGKTTTVETLEGYLTRDGGEVEVLGRDPQHAT
ncbi:MAG TPA: ATP-binding cassette domain-containing protein, partial [Solirubrobacteraceae bacterium]|nr:ATP-binding cassette domain-containing protein [Solirubrobacteraceae bacterium]